LLKLGLEEQSVNSLETVDVITVWPKICEWSNSLFLFISFSATDFMEIAFAVGINEKLVPFVIAKVFVVCAVKCT
jgi:hypothetical protein